MALALRIDEGISSEKTVFVLLSDGEHDEGNLWEAILLASKEKLNNIIAIVDRNNIQIDGYTEDILPLGDLTVKYEAFGWHTQEVNGHSFEEVNNAIERAKAVFEKPSVIIARTIPGKGGKEFERDYNWHGKIPNKEEAKMALKELRTLGGRLKVNINSN